MGIFLERHMSSRQSAIYGDKFKELLGYLEAHYVDSVDLSQLTEGAISHSLKQLDPHTGYLSKKEALWDQSRLGGSFEGIGIEFNIVYDTVSVIRVIPGGPSFEAGLRAGDQIIEVEGESFIGADMDGVAARLRGAEGTRVWIRVKRGEDILSPKEILRGKVDIPTVSAAYMLDKKTAYIALSRFGSQAHTEMLGAIEELKAQGMRRLIFDLRNNGGGYLHIAIHVASMFLEKGTLVTRTQGRKRESRAYRTADSPVVTVPLMVLVNERSASASEIVVGALKDHQRAWIVGRRTFGKGLVQEPMWMSDSSELRLTIARYYTPRGRCIQTPYALTPPTSPISHMESHLSAPKNQGGVLPDRVVDIGASSVGDSVCLLLSPRLIREAMRYCAENEPPMRADLISIPPQAPELLSQLCPDIKNPAWRKQAFPVLKERLLQQIAYMYFGEEGVKKVRKNDEILSQAQQDWHKAEALIQNAL